MKRFISGLRLLALMIGLTLGAAFNSAFAQGHAHGKGNGHGHHKGKGKGHEKHGCKADDDKHESKKEKDCCEKDDDDKFKKEKKDKKEKDCCLFHLPFLLFYTANHFTGLLFNPIFFHPSFFTHFDWSIFLLNLSHIAILFITIFISWRDQCFAEPVQPKLKTP